jgi:hypothetical protein
MRVTLLLLFLVQSLRIFAQPADSAFMVLPLNSFNFGLIQQDKGNVSHSFSFRNTGDIPLVITHIRTTCACIIPDWTREPVLPGKEGSITLSFDPKEQKGAFFKTIQVQSNAINANMFLTINGNVVRAVKKEELHYKIGALCTKSDYINFGYLYKGSTGSETLIIANTTQSALQISFDSVPRHLEIEANPATLLPGEFGQIEVHYYPDSIDDWDVVIDQVAVMLNGKYNKNSKLTITANLREDFSKFSPEQLLTAPVASYKSIDHKLDTITGDKPVVCRYMLSNTGQSDLVIRAVKTSCGCTAVKPQKSILNPGDSTFIEAVYNPGEHTGDFKNGITVITNDPKLYKQYLWLNGYIKRQ